MFYNHYFHFMCFYHVLTSVLLPNLQDYQQLHSTITDSSVLSWICFSTNCYRGHFWFIPSVRQTLNAPWLHIGGHAIWTTETRLLHTLLTGWLFCHLNMPVSSSINPEWICSGRKQEMLLTAMATAGTPTDKYIFMSVLD